MRAQPWRRRWPLWLLALVLAAPLAGETKLLVTVVNKKDGTVVSRLAAGDFVVTSGGQEFPVRRCVFESASVDVALVVDSSLIGPTIAPVAPALVEPLAPKEEMAIVAYDSSADLVQEFTSSKSLLRRALARIRYGNSPRLLDALYATIVDGFTDALYRRIILLVTTGVDGPSRVSLREVLAAARQHEVSIFSVYQMGYGRARLEKLARATGGAVFRLRDLRRSRGPAPSERIFRAMRTHYTLTLSGDRPLGEGFRVRLRRKNKKLLVSSLELN